MISGVTIGDINCFEDWGLVLTDKVIGNPEVETVTIPVPGREGVIDCTKKLYGDKPVYKNRTITLKFQTIDRLSEETWASLQSKINNAWHGQTEKIIFDDDPLYFYSGRINIDSFTTDKALRTIQITADCKPHKYLITDPTQKSL